MEYHVKPLSKTCAATGEELCPGQPCYSALVEREGQLIRFDYSLQGWNGPSEETFGYWRTVVPEPAQTKAKPLDATSLLRYFEQLNEDANPAQDKFRYVLALLLLQKRRLKIDGSREDGNDEYLVLSGSRGEGPFDVRNCHLTDEEIEQLQTDLNTHLAAGWS